MLIKKQKIAKFIFIFVGYDDFTFLATISVNPVTPVPTPVVFDDAQINSGGHYDPTTGIYTVPLNGIYEFYVQIESYQDTDNDWSFSVYVDGDEIAFTRHDASGSSQSGESVSAFLTVLVHLSTGQETWVQAANLDGLYGSCIKDVLLVLWPSDKRRLKNLSPQIDK